MGPFGANGLGLGASMNAAAGFGVGDQTGFASHAARSGFQHAAQLQSQQHNPHQVHAIERQGRSGAAKGRIREVWKHNYQEEMTMLMDLIEEFPYVAMVCLPTNPLFYSSHGEDIAPANRAHC